MIGRRLFLAAGLATVATGPLRAAKAETGLFVHDSPRPLSALDMRDGEGRPVAWADWTGQPALLNLWASWCLPCVAELPALDRLCQTMDGNGARVLALCLDRSGAIGAVNTYARLGIRHLGVLVDHHRKAGEVLAAPVLPTTLLLDGQGREVARHVGPAQWDGPEAVALMRALIQGRPLVAAMAPPPPPKGGVAP